MSSEPRSAAARCTARRQLFPGEGQASAGDVR